MGFYIVAVEFIWRKMGNLSARYRKKQVFWVMKYLIFNLIYLPALLFFQELLFSRKLSAPLLIGAFLAGQIGLLIYDKAYEYVQGHIWTRMRGRFLN